MQTSGTVAVVLATAQTLGSTIASVHPCCAGRCSESHPRFSQAPYNNLFYLFCDIRDANSGVFLSKGVSDYHYILDKKYIIFVD